MANGGRSKRTGGGYLETGGGDHNKATLLKLRGKNPPPGSPKATLGEKLR